MIGSGWTESELNLFLAFSNRNINTYSRVPTYFFEMKQTQNLHIRNFLFEKTEMYST